VNRLRQQQESDFEIVGEAASGQSAVRLMTRQRPTLAFLDVRLPEFDGLEVLRRVGPEGLPKAVIFVSAHDEYAIRAFDVHAVDYLLKPFSARRLHQALNRVRLELAKDAALAQIQRKGPVGQPGLELPARAEDQLTMAAGAYVDRLAVRDRDRFLILRTDAVDWIEAAANYAELHSEGKTFLLRTTMNELEERLNPKWFVRVHRTAIVNLERVSEIVPSEHGDYTIVLRDRTTLRLSRTHRDRVLSLMYPYLKGDSQLIDTSD
jgi:two-component system LytT family response regulator